MFYTENEIYKYCVACSGRKVGIANSVIESKIL